MIKKHWKNLLLKLSSSLIICLFINSAFSVEQNKKYRADETPHSLKDIKITERLSKYINLKLKFTDENNKLIPLSNYFNSTPVLMTVVYYNCPSLCNFHLNGLFETLEKLSISGWKLPYKFVILSMDDTETASLAKEKKTNYLKKFKNLNEKNIHFLTGSYKNIKNITDSLGFAFRWDEETEQFAHSPVAYTLSPTGMISRYLYGIDFLPKTLRLALLSAGEGKVGNMIDRVLLFCYRFNPRENQYTLYASKLMKIGGILIVIALILLLTSAWVKERRKNV